jgi:hypothetical protein
MKTYFKQACLATIGAGVLILTLGCETLPSPVAMEPIENYGGAGGGDQ